MMGLMASLVDMAASVRVEKSFVSDPARWVKATELAPGARKASLDSLRYRRKLRSEGEKVKSSLRSADRQSGMEGYGRPGREFNAGRDADDRLVRGKWARAADRRPDQLTSRPRASAARGDVSPRTQARVLDYEKNSPRRAREQADREAKWKAREEESRKATAAAEAQAASDRSAREAAQAKQARKERAVGTAVVGAATASVGANAYMAGKYIKRRRDEKKSLVDVKKSAEERVINGRRHKVRDVKRSDRDRLSTAAGLGAWKANSNASQGMDGLSNALDTAGYTMRTYDGIPKRETRVSAKGLRRSHVVSGHTFSDKERDGRLSIRRMTDSEKRSYNETRAAAATGVGIAGGIGAGALAGSEIASRKKARSWKAKAATVGGAAVGGALGGAAGYGLHRGVPSAKTHKVQYVGKSLVELSKKAVDNRDKGLAAAAVGAGGYAGVQARRAKTAGAGAELARSTQAVQNEDKLHWRGQARRLNARATDSMNQAKILRAGDGFRPESFSLASQKSLRTSAWRDRKSAVFARAQEGEAAGAERSASQEHWRERSAARKAKVRGRVGAAVAGTAVAALGAKKISEHRNKSAVAKRDWKNIEQRKTETRRARKQQVTGTSMVGAGVPMLVYGEALDGSATAAGTGKFARQKYKAAREPINIPGEKPIRMSRRAAAGVAARAVRDGVGGLSPTHKLGGAATVAGAGLVAGGMGMIASGNARRRHNENKIAQMRKKRELSRVEKAVVPKKAWLRNPLAAASVTGELRAGQAEGALRRAAGRRKTRVGSRVTDRGARAANAMTNPEIGARSGERLMQLSEGYHKAEPTLHALKGHGSGHHAVSAAGKTYAAWRGYA